MKKTTLTAIAFLLSLAQSVSNADAGVVLYDGGNFAAPVSGDPGGFTYGDFGGGQVTDTGNSLLIDTATEIEAGNGLFGGLGRDLATPFDFDANAAGSFFRLEYRILPNNAAQNFTVTLSDLDSPTTAQDYQFVIDSTFASALGDGSGYSEQFVPIAQGDSVFNQPSGGFSAGDSTLDFGLRQWQIQSVFGAPERLNIEIRRAEIVTAAIPEPGSFALIAALTGAAATRRRRK